MATNESVCFGIMCYMIFVISSSTWVYTGRVSSLNDRQEETGMSVARKSDDAEKLQQSTGKAVRQPHAAAETTRDQRLLCTVGTEGHPHRATYLHILEAVLLADTSQNILLAAFLHFTSQKEFVQDEVCLLKIEDDVQLAHIAIIFVHLFHVSVNDLQGNQLVIGRSAAGDEEQRSIAAVDNFGV